MENPQRQTDSILEKNTPHLEIKQEFTSFIPSEFARNPLEYFEREGVNIKKGEKKIDEHGVVRDDPTAVKDFPAWKDESGARELYVVGKKVNSTKGKVGKSQDPFYEYKVIEHITSKGLPVAKLVGKVEQDGVCLILTERIPGLRMSELDTLNLREKGYSDEDVARILGEAEQMMNELKIRFEAEGIIRKWKLKDMVFQLDIDAKKLLSIVPTDWERTKVNTLL